MADEIEKVEEKEWDYGEDKLVDLDPDFMELAIKIVAEMKEKGIKFRVTSAYRSPEEQDKLYAQGRTEPGKTVTKAQGGESMHNFGKAIDVAFFDDEGNYITDGAHPAYAEYGKIAKGYGLTWGGDWGWDFAHIELGEEGR